MRNAELQFQCGHVHFVENIDEGGDLDLLWRASGTMWVKASAEMTLGDTYEYIDDYFDPPELVLDDYSLLDYEITDWHEWDDYEMDELYVACPSCGCEWIPSSVRVVIDGEEGEVETPEEVTAGDNLADFFSTLVQKAG